MQNLPLDRRAGAAADQQVPAGEGLGDLSLRPLAGAVSPAVVAAVAAQVKTIRILQYGPVSGVEGTIFHLLLPPSSLFDAGIYSIGFGACRVNAVCAYNPDGTLDLTAVVPSRSQAFYGSISADLLPRFARLCLILEQGCIVYSGPLSDHFEYKVRYTESLGSDYMTTPTSATTPNGPWSSSPSSSPPGSPFIKQEPKACRAPLPSGCEGYYCAIDESVIGLGDLRKWTPEEISNRRRRIRARVSEDSPRVCYFDRLSYADMNEEDVVISCIWWEELEACYITSVDVIILLGYIMDVVLDIPQKNRIRRNLESLGPTTVSKKPDTNAFFAQVMSYADPKPRNIEKDVKVFPWALLKPALEKILYKMTDGGGNVTRHEERE
ncbi:hypothetical protein HDU87_003355 [Geranomyces variabilis]|uniref:DUF7082 domain-containing protein n=1 Tax=Geranomyces variabilis TaxID=109894 RepID=A0AAD5XN77_9FUNG|nr:hypothetical protein HDU87_003355 [Geranomyces variabilis]